jgi:hypothetical protein
MATRTTVCPGCQAAVPRGRLSCPSCGLLLASVAGSGRGSKATGTSAKAATPRQAAVPAPPVTLEPSSIAETALPPVGAYVPRAAAPGPNLLPARAWAGITSAAPRPMAMATAGAMPAYAAQASGPAMVGASQAIPARADADPRATLDAPDAAEPAAEPTWLEATAGWLMIIGSAVAILGFLLPWSSTVIGAEGAGSYFDTWGMASPSHVMVVLALLAVLGLAIVANPIPTWIRTCAAGLTLGGLLVGLTWPYLFGPLGAGPGVMSILVGGLMLGIAGVVDLVEARHAASGPLV